MSPCLTYAIHYLNKYPKTVRDMRLQLSKKWFPLEEIEQAMLQLEKSGYLDDAVYARSYFNSEVVRKGKPLLLIKQKLISKWVDKSLLLELIDEMEEEMQEWQSWKIAKEIERLRWKGKTDPEIVQTLVRKGFAYDSIKKTLHWEQ